MGKKNVQHSSTPILQMIIIIYKYLFDAFQAVFKDSCTKDTYGVLKINILVYNIDN